jgi:cytochrome c-type biogenesis protein CcmH
MQGPAKGPCATIDGFPEQRLVLAGALRPAMLLWVSISLLTLAVTAILVWPLLIGRSTSLAPDDELQRRLAVFRDRRNEIRADAEAGRSSKAQAEQAQADLLRQMAEELPAEWLSEGSFPAGSATPSAASGASRRIRASRLPFLAGLLVALAIPLLAFGVYRGVGSPEVALAQLEGKPLTRGDSAQARFDAIVAEIETRLRANPSDGEAWAVLAEAYKLVGNHGAAIEAFEKAVELLPPDARLLADYAESSALAGGGNFSGRPTQLLARALEVDPNDQKAVALMGAARYRAGDLPEARRYLRQLLVSLPADSPEATQIGEVVAQIEAELGGAASSTPPLARGGAERSGSPGAAPGTPSDMASGTAPRALADDAPNAAAGPPSAPVRGTVSLAPSLTQRLPPQATLFVVARAAQGPRIPLAVLRVPAASLPYQFELGDANAMDPSRPMSSAAQIVLEARISASGEAMRQPGDLYGQAPPVQSGARDVAILIDQVVAQ